MEKIKRWLTNPRVLLVIAILLVLFNFIDGGLSFWSIYIAKIAYEANPIMAWVMNISPYLFLAFKFLVPPVIATFLYKNIDNKWARWGLISAFLLYLGLMVHFGLLIATAVSAGVI